MATQVGSHLIGGDIDLGNAVVYYSNSPFSTFSAAKSATAWHKLGHTKEGVQMDVSREFAEFFSGFPAKKINQYVAAENFALGGQITEFEPIKLAKVFGGLTLTSAVKSSSPTPTTTQTGSTTTVIQVASVAGFAVNDMIRVGTDGYGRIKSIDSGDGSFTLYEGLTNDTAPAASVAVSKVDTISFDIGSLARPAYHGLKIVKTLVGGLGSYNIYVLKGQFVGDISTVFPDNTAAPTDAIGVPFGFSALSEPDNESGNVARVEFSIT